MVWPEVDDPRPWFVVTVTGHPDVIPGGLWTSSVIQMNSFEQPGAADVRRYLDDALWRKRGSHRVMLRCRSGDAGIDTIVRAYAAARKLSCLPHIEEGVTWRRDAPFRRDLKMIADSHAVVWFGPREDGLDSIAPDLVTLATWLGIPCRAVALNGTAAAEQY